MSKICDKHIILTKSNKCTCYQMSDYAHCYRCGNLICAHCNDAGFLCPACEIGFTQAKRVFGLEEEPR